MLKASALSSSNRGYVPNPIETSWFVGRTSQHLSSQYILHAGAACLSDLPRYVAVVRSGVWNQTRGHNRLRVGEVPVMPTATHHPAYSVHVGELAWAGHIHFAEPSWTCSRPGYGSEFACMICKSDRTFMTFDTKQWWSALSITHSLNVAGEPHQRHGRSHISKASHNSLIRQIRLDTLFGIEAR